MLKTNTSISNIFSACSVPRSHTSGGTWIRREGSNFGHNTYNCQTAAVHKNKTICRPSNTHTHTRLTALFLGLPGWAGTRTHTHTHTNTRLTALCPGLPGWAGTRKVKPIWILLKQDTVSGSGISRNICKSAPRSRQITTPTPHHSVFYRPDALPAAQPTASKHWRHYVGLAI